MSIQTTVFREFISDMSSKERESMSSVKTVIKTTKELILNTKGGNAESDAIIVFQEDSLRYASALIRNN